MLASALGAHQVPAAVADVILARTEGNPFFLEEFCRAVVEDPSVAAARAAPVTVQDIVLSRVHRLSEDDQRLLRCAAVIGRDVPQALLRAVSGLDMDVMAPALARLTAAQFVREATVPSEPGSAFTHVLTQEAVYGTLGADERVRLHRRAVDAIEAAYPGRLVEHLDALAHHVVRGEMWDKALTYLRHIGSAESRPLDDRAGAVCGASPHWIAGQHDRALERAEADLVIARHFTNFEGHLIAHLQLGQAHHSLGRYREAIEVLRRNATMLAGELRVRRFETLPGLAAVLSGAWLAMAHAELRAREATDTADASREPYDVGVASWAAGTVALIQGAVDRAAAALGRARDCAREGRAGDLVQLVAAPLAAALARSGTLDEATAIVGEWSATPERQRIEAGHARRLAWHAEVEALAGRLDHAASLARQAVDLARAHAERGDEAHALATLADVLASRDPVAAERASTHAHELAVALGMRPLAARCRPRPRA
jgi:tetratricopeptide (TPR) repeat protein